MIGAFLIAAHPPPFLPLPLFWWAHTHPGASYKATFIVMENLFYDRAISKIFDLKGGGRMLARLAERVCM